MSAIEMMDPKMDAGMLCNQIKRKVRTLEQSVEVTTYLFLIKNLWLMVLFSDLCSVYSESRIRSIEHMPGILIGCHNINNFCFADDTVLIATSEKELQTMLDADSVL